MLYKEALQQKQALDLDVALDLTKPSAVVLGDEFRKTVASFPGMLSDAVSGIGTMVGSGLKNAAVYTLPMTQGAAGAGILANYLIRRYNKGRAKEDKLPRHLLTMLAALAGAAGSGLLWNKYGNRVMSAVSGKGAPVQSSQGLPANIQKAVAEEQKMRKTVDDWNARHSFSYY